MDNMYFIHPVPYCTVLTLSTYFTLPLFSLVSGPGGEAARTATGETPGVAPARETGLPRMESQLQSSSGTDH